MLNRYRLGDSQILTTEARYEATFKSMGYVPYEEEIKEPEDSENELNKQNIEPEEPEKDLEGNEPETSNETENPDDLNDLENPEEPEKGNKDSKKSK